MPPASGIAAVAGKSRADNLVHRPRQGQLSPKNIPVDIVSGTGDYKGGTLRETHCRVRLLPDSLPDAEGEVIDEQT
jgi:hypothetical protein